MMDKEPTDNGIIETVTCTNVMDLMGYEFLDIFLCD